MANKKTLQIKFYKFSLVLTEDDYNIITEIDHQRGDMFFRFFHESNVLDCFDINGKIKFGVIFNRVFIDEEYRYEISEIRYRIEFVEELLKDVYMLTDRSKEAIKDVYENIDYFLFDLSKNKYSFSYSYYILNKDDNTFQIFSTFERMKISEIIDHKVFYMAIYEDPYSQQN